MPLLFYFPFIVWMGMVKVVQDEMLHSTDLVNHPQ
jgi:hypothetical protein